MIVGQIAREKYGVPKVIARVNDPRNQPHFDLLGISPTICATSSVMALIEHEVPEHDLIHLLELREENLEIVEVQIDGDSPCAGRRVEALSLPEGSRLISVCETGGPRSPSARRCSRRATRCSRSSSRARRTNYVAVLLAELSPSAASLSPFWPLPQRRIGVAFPWATTQLRSRWRR